jgi:hypothetical protein
MRIFLSKARIRGFKSNFIHVWLGFPINPRRSKAILHIIQRAREVTLQDICIVSKYRRLAKTRYLFKNTSQIDHWGWRKPEMTQ